MIHSPKYKGEVCSRCERPFGDNETRYGYREYRWFFNMETMRMERPLPETHDEKFEKWETLGEQRSRCQATTTP